jgi:Protein of unknown function (DUF2911)
MRAFAFSLSLELLSLTLVGPMSLVSTPARAEVELPPAAPAAKVIQQVGLTEIGVEYNCPAAKGREIWGDIVPFGKVWLTGSHAAPKIRFSKDVKIGGRPIPAGAYWLLAIPETDTWTVILNKSAAALNSIRDYKPDLDVSRLKIAPKIDSPRERLTYAFTDVTDDGASLDLEWGSWRVSVPIQVNTSQQVQAAINDLDGTARSFANAARYMLETKKDYDAGLKYIDDALSLKEDWTSMWVKGHLLAAKGDFVAARDWGERARALASRAGNAGTLEPELDRSVAEWSRRSGRPEKESRPLSKVSERSPERGPDKSGDDAGDAVGEKLRDDAPAKSANAQVNATTAPPPFTSPSPPSQARTLRESPVDEPAPALRRARLRHR